MNMCVKLARGLIISLVAFWASVDCKSAFTGAVQVQAQVQRNLQELEDCYYELLREGFFDLSYQGTLVPGFDRAAYKTFDARHALTLVEWLQANNTDPRAHKLLQKMAGYLFTDFVRHLATLLHAQTVGAGKLMRVTYDLYSFADQAQLCTQEHAQQARLHIQFFVLRVILIRHLINASEQSYGDKRQSLAMLLDEQKQIFFAQALPFFGSTQAAELKKLANRLSELLSELGIPVPVTQSHTFRNVLIGTTVVAVVTYGGYRVYTEGDVKEWFADILKVFEESKFGKWLFGEEKNSLVAKQLAEARKRPEKPTQAKLDELRDALNGKITANPAKQTEYQKEVEDYEQQLASNPQGLSEVELVTEQVMGIADKKIKDRLDQLDELLRIRLAGLDETIFNTLRQLHGTLGLTTQQVDNTLHNVADRFVSENAWKPGLANARAATHTHIQSPPVDRNTYGLNPHETEAEKFDDDSDD